MTAIRIAAWVAAQLEKDIAKAQTAQQLAIRMSRARHDGWEKELNRKDKHKRPSQWLMHKRYEKDTAALHKSVCDIYLAMVLGGCRTGRSRGQRCSDSRERCANLVAPGSRAKVEKCS